ncbi:MAG TPA: GspE/PulE family protein [Thermoanaerobaculia bacterium]|nr:GspE/PulE family protein [Thermoanaerobaculia bacterium]
MADQGSPHPPGAPGFTELSQYEVDERSVRLIDRDFCLENLVVVLGKVDPASREPVPVGMIRPFRRSLTQEISQRLRRPVQPVQLNAWEIRRAVETGWGGEEEDERGGTVLTLRPTAGFSFGPETPVPILLDEILGHAVELGASDVHVETYEHDVDVRFRVDGVMRQITTPLSHDNIDAVISRIKVISRLDVAERRKAQDGRIRAVYEEKGEERAIDFRVSTVPGPFGEDAVLRLLDSGTPVLGLERLGLDPSILPVFEQLIANPEGLLLVTGPTGSGKTTTLYSAIHHIRRPEIKILTAEDPIEYYFDKTSQKQVSMHMSFADYARTFMRQNPDVILIGEIRDEETAAAAIRAAQTGHLVLSTLHTSDAVRTVSRLHTLGVDLNLIAGSLLGVVSQRLARRLCPHCKQEAAPDPVEARRLRLGADERFFCPVGCEACRGAGYKGRLGIYELFVPDSEVADLIAEGTPVHRLREVALEKAMRTLRDDALAKARAGLISLAEVLRTVPYRILEG